MRMRTMSVALVVALVVALAVPGVTTWTGTRHEATGPAGVELATSGLEQPAPDQVAVKVHGRWHIQVRNPDGSLVEDRKFENALAPGAEKTLTRILARGDTPGWWRIVVSANRQTTGGPCGTADVASISPCVLTEQPGALPANFSRTLTARTEPGTPDLVLSGSAVAGPRGGLISLVETQVAVCSNTVAPAACAAASDATVKTVTEKVIDPFLRVESGQQVQITVRISFS